MKRRRTPQRTCVGCGRTEDKRMLVRIVRTPLGEVVADGRGRMNGRGAYVCDEACFDRAAGGRLAKALDRAISAEEAARIRAEVAVIAAARRGDADDVDADGESDPGDEPDAGGDGVDEPSHAKERVRDG